jgi:8-oxo-dGTP pyrophosphatase MutT (NUDIX family)
LRTSLASTAVVLGGDGHVLLVHTDEDVWMLPGGQLEPGESPQEAVVRELREEVGVGAAPERFVGVYTLRLAEETHYRFVFICSIDREPTLTGSDEVTDVAWYPPDALPLPLARLTPTAIEDALAGRIGVTRTLGPHGDAPPAGRSTT